MNSFSHSMHQLKDKGNINWFKCSFTKILYFTLLFRAFSILPEPVTSSVTKAFLKMPKFRKKNFFLRLKLDRQPRTSQVYPFLSLEFLKSKNYFFLSPLLPLVPVNTRSYVDRVRVLVGYSTRKMIRSKFLLLHFIIYS